MPDSLSDRGRIEAARITSGTNLAQYCTPQIPGFDTTTMPVELDLPVKPRDPKSVVMLTVHVTDVPGGFGVAKSLVAKWRLRLELGKVPADLESQLPDPADLGGSSFLLGLLELNRDHIPLRKRDRDAVHDEQRPTHERGGRRNRARDAPVVGLSNRLRGGAHAAFVSRPRRRASRSSSR